MTSAGILTLDVIPDMKGFAAKLAAGSNTAAAGAESRLKMTGAIAAGAGLAVAAFAKKSVEAFVEAQKAEERLAFAYSKFPKLADVSLASLKALAEETQKKTVFDHEATTQAEALLAQFDLTGKQVEQLIPLIQDYAAATGQDLASATTAIGKAFEGNTRALKSVGITFKATGDRAKDFTTIQGLLNDKVGGFAERQGKTAAGQAQILSNEYKDLQETVGAALVPALQTLMDVVTPLLQGFNALPAPAKQLIVIGGGLGTVALVLAPRILALRTAFTTTAVAATETAAAEALQTTAAEASVGANTAAAAATKTLGTRMATAGANAVTFGLRFAAAGIALGVAFKALEGAGPGVEKTATALDKITAGDKTQNIGRFATDLGSLSTELDHLAHPDVYDKIGDSLTSILTLGSSQGRFSRAQTLSDLNDLDLALVKIATEQGAPAATKAFAALTSAQGLNAGQVSTLTGLLPGYTGALDGATVAGAKAGAATDAQTAANKLLIPTLSDLYGLIESQTIAKMDFADADKAATAAAKEANRTHKDTSAAFRDILTAADKARDATVKVADKDAAYRGELVKLRDQTKAGSPLRKTLDEFIAKLDAAAKDRTAKLTVTLVLAGKMASILANPTSGKAIDNRLYPAGGGYVTGPGSGTSDSIPANLSNGEFVLNAQTVQQVGLNKLMRLNAGQTSSVGGGNTVIIQNPPPGNVEDQAYAAMRRLDLLYAR